MRKAVLVFVVALVAACGNAKVTTPETGLPEYAADSVGILDWVDNTPVISAADNTEICILKSVAAARREAASPDFEPRGVYFVHHAYEALPTICAVSNARVTGTCARDWNALGAHGWRSGDHFVTQHVLNVGNLEKPGYIFVSSFGDYDALFGSLSAGMAKMLGKSHLAAQIESLARERYNACRSEPANNGNPANPEPPPGGGPVNPKPPPDGGGPINPNP